MKLDLVFRLNGDFIGFTGISGSKYSSNLYVLLCYMVHYGDLKYGSFYMGFQQTYKTANDIETSQTEHNYKLFRIERSIYFYKNKTYLI